MTSNAAETSAVDYQASSTVVSQRLAKALAHPLRIQILVETNKRPMSATEFANHVGGSVSPSKAAQHFRYLERLGCLEPVGTKTGGKRRGGRERFYRAIQRSLFDDSSWHSLPSTLQGEVASVTFSTYLERVAEAMEAGTFNARQDRHLTWIAMHVDQEGWDELIRRTDELFDFALKLRIQAAMRLARSGEQPIPVTVGYACFESPKGSEVSPLEVHEATS
ncbi:MAG TPA: winged helix-turn-helix domain-containing protein [Solirubrobacterales bacterium]|nr:winged helix-turn-helix domain-containing protein [Solirubrobacterales bacterium]